MWPTFALLSPCVELQIHRRNWKTTLSATVQTQDSWKPCQTVAVWVCFSGKQHSDKSTVEFEEIIREQGGVVMKKCTISSVLMFALCGRFPWPGSVPDWVNELEAVCSTSFHSVYINASLSPVAGSQSDTSEAVWSWKTAASGKSCCIWSAWVQLQTLSYQKVFLAKADSAVDRLVLMCLVWWIFTYNRHSICCTWKQTSKASSTRLESV